MSDKKTYFVQVVFGDGKSLTPVIKQTEKGRSAYANRMYQHYFNTKGKDFANQIKVYESYIDPEDFSIKTFCVWSA